MVLDAGRLVWEYAVDIRDVMLTILPGRVCKPQRAP